MVLHTLLQVLLLQHVRPPQLPPLVQLPAAVLPNQTPQVQRVHALLQVLITVHPTQDLLQIHHHLLTDQVLPIDITAFQVLHTTTYQILLATATAIQILPLAALTITHLLPAVEVAVTPLLPAAEVAAIPPLPVAHPAVHPAVPHVAVVAVAPLLAEAADNNITNRNQTR